MQKTAKKIALLGSTGSIGKSVLDVVKIAEGQLKVIGLSTGSNFEALVSQAREFSPRSLHKLRAR